MCNIFEKLRSSKLPFVEHIRDMCNSRKGRGSYERGSVHCRRPRRFQDVGLLDVCGKWCFLNFPLGFHNWEGLHFMGGGRWLIMKTFSAHYEPCEPCESISTMFIMIRVCILLVTWHYLRKVLDNSESALTVPGAFENVFCRANAVF